MSTVAYSWDSVALTLAAAYDLNFELRFDIGRQYFLALPMSELEERQLPDVFVHPYRRKNLVECMTLDLMKLNQKITDSHHEVLQMSARVIQDLVDSIRAEVAPLFRISDSLALLDMLASFAHTAAVHDYCRPELTSSLAIKSGRHPIVEIAHRDRFIPNDVFANKMSRLQVITGCNMSGKSTYLRSIALITIMVQVGCFAPAEYASVPIRHQLLARLSLDDSSLADLSTFAEEMRGMAFVLQHIDDTTLVLVDELGRGTSSADGLAIAVAIAERLLDSQAFVFWVTHFQELAVALAERPGLKCLHLEVEVQEDVRMSMLYRVAPGPNVHRDSGLLLAKAIGMPQQVIETATRVSNALQKERQQRTRLTHKTLGARRAKLVMSLKQQLEDARDSNLEGRDLIQWLQQLQQEFLRRMKALDEEQENLQLTEGEQHLASAEDEQNSTLTGEQQDKAPMEDVQFDGETGSSATSVLLLDGNSEYTDDSRSEHLADRRYMMSGAL